MESGLYNGLLEIGGASKPPASDFGVIYNQSGWGNLNNWTATGSPTTSISGGELTISGGVNDFNRYLVQSAYGTTNLMDWRRVFIFRPQTLTAASDAVCIGIRQDGAFNPRSMQAGMVVTTGVNKGLLRIFRAGSIVASSSSNLTFALNDRIMYLLTRSGWTYNFVVRNITPGSENSVSVSFTVTPTSAPSSLHWTGKFATWAVQGTQIVEVDYVTTTGYRYPKTVFVGDSKTEGIGVSLITSAYPYLTFKDSGNTYNVIAKGNNQTQDVLNTLHEIIAMRPKYVVLNIGRNDLDGGVSSSTWQANYTSIVRQLKNEGIKVVHLLPFKETVLNQSSLRDYIVNNYSNDFIVDTYTNFNTSTMLAADNIHPNVTGATFISNQIKNTVPFSI